MTSASVAPARTRNRARRGEATTGYLFIAPAILGFLVFVLGPLVVAAYLSLTRYDVVTAPEFVGIDNYLRMLTDERLHTTYLNTIIYVVAAVILINGFALVLAVLVNRRLPAGINHILKSAYFFPSLVGLAYVSVIWQALFQQDTGIVNYYLVSMGGPRIDWLNGSVAGKVAVIIVDTWRNVGFAMLIYVSALQDLPKEILEAAEIDGAGPWRKFRKIIAPMISPAIFFNVTMTMIGAFQIYESIIVLTGGGPGDSTRSIVMYIAELAFQNFKMGYASAVAMTLFLIILALTAIQFRMRRRWVHSE
jgi:multiple sugar transport system permease protein